MDYRQLFKRFSSIKILVVGDVMIDRYLVGSVNRISPEAPVPVVNLNTTEDRLGGAANVALNLHALGAQSFLLSVIGADANAATFRDLAISKGLPIEGLLNSTERQTTIKSRIIASNQHLLRIDEEDTFALTVAEEQQLLEKVSFLLTKHRFDVILFQDYNKGVLTKTVIKKVIEIAQKADIPTVVDPKFHNFWTYKGVTLFKPNLKEIQEALSRPIAVNALALAAAANDIREQLGAVKSLITLSDKGIFVDSGDHYEVISTKARQIADVCGAGDTVISVAALGVALRLNLHQIATIANIAGGQVCERIGVVTVDKAELLEELLQG